MDIQHISYRMVKGSAKPALSRKALLRIILWKEQQGQCHYCSQPTLLFVDDYDAQMATIEHLCPRSLGGPNHIRNFVMSCQLCNNRRSSKPYEAFCREMQLNLNEGKRRLAAKRERTFRRKHIRNQLRQGIQPTTYA